MAQRLGTTVARERRLEQRAAIALRLAAATGRCSGSPAPPAVISHIVSAVPSGALSDIADAENPSSGPAGRPSPAGAALHIQTAARSDRSRRGPAPKITVQSSSFPSLAHARAAFPWVLVLVAMLALAGVAMLLRSGPAVMFSIAVAERRLRRRLTSAGAVTGAAKAKRPRDASGELAALPDEIGDPEGAVRLGEFLEGRGELDRAMAAYGSAMQHGSPRGAVGLGLLRAQRGDLSGALEAFSYADQLGDGAGAFNLGVVLEEQGDLDGAVSAFKRAQSSSDAEVADKARAAVTALSRQSAD